jgi:acyl-CoA dehydrogenase
MVLKHFENQGRPEADLPLVEWACRFLLYRTQEQLHAFLRNFPVRPVAMLLRVLVFPRGRTYHAPRDGLARRIVEAVISPGETRDRLCEGVYRTVEPNNQMGLLQEAMELAIEVAPLEKKLRKGQKDGKIKAPDFPRQLKEAVAAGVLSQEEADRLAEVDEKVMYLIHVDDFAKEELGPIFNAGERARSPARRKTRSRKSAAAETAEA